jgi:5'-3' exonuclease
MSALTTNEIFDKINYNRRDSRILVDFSSIYFRTAYGMARELEKTAYEDFNMVKHSIIFTILNFKKKLKHLKEIVVAIDSRTEKKQYWRHEIYPGYKLGRKHQESLVPKDLFYKAYNELQEEFNTLFPWKVIIYNGAEADDIIAVICDEFKNENNIIYSPDKDFIQMLNHSYNNYVYDPIKRLFVYDNNPDKYIFNHICTGDKSDNIPNILSEMNCLNEGKRMSPLRKNKINDWYYIAKENDSIRLRAEMSEKIYVRYLQNKKIIDLLEIPSELKENIIKKYNDTSFVTDQNGLWKYLHKNNMKILLDNFNSFWK